MGQNSDAAQMLSSSHEYPDPDSAAYITSYPWVRGVSPSTNVDASNEFVHQQFDLAGEVVHLTQNCSAEEDSDGEAYGGPELFAEEDGFDVDSEYLASDNDIR